MTLDIIVHRVYFFFESGVIFYVFMINTIYFFLTAVAFFTMRRHHAPLNEAECASLAESPLLPAISLIVPAHNEEMSVEESVGGMLHLRYPLYEVIVVNDGSKDATMQKLTDKFRLFKSGRAAEGPLQTKPIRHIYESRDPIPLVVIDKENGGKADAINAGLQVARSPLVMVVDCDSLIDRDALLNMAKPFLEDPERTIAVGGTVRSVNDCGVEHGMVRKITTSSSWLANFQAVEYLRAFFGGRVGFSLVNGLMIISGASGMFRRDAVMEAGGFDEATIGEDMELVVRLHRIWRLSKKPYRIVYTAAPVCWTEVPQTLRILRRQRKRWQRGTVESLRKHREMLFNPKFGVVGLFSFPYFFFFEMLGPAVELLGYLLTIVGLTFRIISPGIALLFFSVSIMFGILLSTTAVLLDEFTSQRYPSWRHTVRLFLVAIVENFGFRQMLTYFRVQGLIDGLKEKKGDWGVMERRGFQRFTEPRP